MFVPSETAIPADSCPRCCWAKRPKYVSRATSSPGAHTPKSPHSSFGDSAPIEDLSVSRRSLRDGSSYGSLRDQRDREVAGDGPEPFAVEREHRTSVPLRAGDDGRVGESQRELRVAAHQRPDPGQVQITAVEQGLAGLDAFQESEGGGRREPAAEHPVDLREDADRNDGRH